jgi:hypothetical protein
MPKYTRNEDGTLTQETEGGYKALVIDPDGSFEREMSGQAPPGAAEWAASQPHQSSVPNPYQPQLSPENKAALAQPPVVGPTASPVIQPDKPFTTPQVAPLAASGGGAPRATLVDDAPAGGMATASKTDSSTSVTTEGLDKDSKSNILDAAAKTKAASEEATTANRAANEKVAAQREGQAKQDFMSGYIKQVGALEAQDQYGAEYKRALEERKAARATKIDPTKAFGSERNSWAIVAGLEGALAALDEGISRLQKRGSPPPSTLISDMVERSIKMQEDERAQRIAGAEESAEAAREGMLEARSNAHEAAAQVLEARKMVAGSAEQVAFLDAEAAKQRVAATLADEEIAKATATRKSVQNTTRTSTESGPTGPGKKTPGQMNNEANLRQLYRIRDTLRRSEKSGALTGVVGWQDKLGANSVQEFFGGLPPEQKEAATALQELEVGNLMRLVREPNNKNTQDMVQRLGQPKNDRDIPGSLSRLDQLIADQEAAVQNAAPEAPATPAEQY